MSVVNAVPLLEAAGGGYQISRSVRLRSSASAYFNRTPASATSQTTWTWSGWVKRGALTVASSPTLFAAGSSSQPYCTLNFTATDQLQFDAINTGSVVVGRKFTTSIYRDPSAWYHIVFVWDTTNATAVDRMRIYVNGVRLTAFSLSSDPALNATTQVNTAAAHYIGSFVGAGNYNDGYMTEVNFIDGQALTPSSFGETDALTGVWKPKKYAGTYGTNGFYLNFSDNSSATATGLGKDLSGNANNWTPNNISVTAGVTYDSMLDVPTLWADGGNGRGNYAVLNPLDKDTACSVAGGNLDWSSSAGGTGQTRGTIGMSSGKWYWEVTSTTTASMGIGISTQQSSLALYPGGDAYGWSYFNSNGNKFNNGSSTAYGATYTTNDVIGVAFDADAGTLVFYKNGTSQGTAFSSLTSGPYFPAIGDGSASTAPSGSFNFGQRPFSYTPPTGFKALNTQNLPDATIKNGASYMAATTYTGNGGTQTISNAVNGVSFQPDLIWTKSRNNATDHFLLDSVRGGSAVLFSDLTNAESTGTNYISAFLSGGFSTNSASSGINASGYTYVGWQWQAGKGSTSSNTSGSITSTVSVNATAGFSIVTYTGNGSSSATVGHGLGVTPSMIICKSRSDVINWFVFHKSLTSANYIQLNTTAAQATIASTTQGALSTSPTSSTFGFTAGTTGVNNVNTNTSTYVAYCFADVAGYSKFGSYTGNGAADGPFVHCGFRPRFVMVKRTDTAGYGWFIEDSSRDTYNLQTHHLRAELSDAEVAAGWNLDTLSNGFKLRETGLAVNASGGTYIFAAFAEVPLKYSLGR